MPTAEDVERPKCECHDEPMSRHGPGWRCAVTNRERFRARLRDPEFAQRNRDRVAAHYRAGGREMKQRRARERKALGLCVKCDNRILTEAVCWDCLNRMEERRALG